MKSWKLLFPILLVASILFAQDTHCPAYPVAVRQADQQILNRDREFERYQLSAASSDERGLSIPPGNNFIDDLVFGKMRRDGVNAADLTTDSEFVRRVYLDLTGRIPTLDQAQTFLSNTASDRRSCLVEQLMTSDAYADQFTHWFVQRFRITTKADSRISPQEGYNFWNFVRNFVVADSPYDAFVRSMLTASGDADQQPAIAFLGRFFTLESPIQDQWDAFTDGATTQFLGFKTDCISCHDGRRHLENINLFLAPHPRKDFWKLSAFFARTRIQIVSDDTAGFRPRLILSNVPSGFYTGAVDPTNPGARPTRTDANERPLYWLSGQQEPANGNWQQEFARILTSDRQFGRAAVNYIWAYFFGSGIVDPPNGWDLRRTDPANPPPEGWPFQNANPELLEALTDRFIQSNYSLKTIIRLIVNSNAYQLSMRYPSAWNDNYARYFARREARRLSAEQLVDSLITATDTVIPMEGVPGRILRYANQMAEPFQTGSPFEPLLISLGRGDWINQLPTNKPSLLGVLDFFNSWSIDLRIHASSGRSGPQTQLSVWVAQGLSDNEILQRMFMATLTRPPTAAEIQAVMAHKLTDRGMWLTSVQWALLQKIDFVFY
jgi:hypothetical protein